MSVDECRAELRKVYQRDNEHILAYISRVREIKATLLETERREKGAVHPSELQNIEEIAITSFCQGLIPIIRAGMSLAGYDSLTDAFAHAQTVTAVHKTGEERRRRDRREREVRIRARSRWVTRRQSSFPHHTYPRRDENSHTSEKEREIPDRAYITMRDRMPEKEREIRDHRNTINLLIHIN